MNNNELFLCHFINTAFIKTAITLYEQLYIMVTVHIILYNVFF